MESNQSKLVSVISLCMAIAFPGISSGALIDRGEGLVYDTDLDITWLVNSISMGSSYDTADGVSDGLMTWQNAMDWAADLLYYYSARDVLYGDWRLPTTLTPDFTCTNQVVGAGSNCTGSEMGHLFYIETNENEWFTFSGWNTYYWSASEYGLYPDDMAFAFSSLVGYQAPKSKIISYRAIAVRDGDVAAVPLPAAIWLLTSGLFAMLSSGSVRWSGLSKRFQSRRSG